MFECFVPVGGTVGEVVKPLGGDVFLGEVGP